jgi:hypothetical protein
VPATEDVPLIFSRDRCAGDFPLFPKFSHFLRMCRNGKSKADIDPEHVGWGNPWDSGVAAKDGKA